MDKDTCAPLIFRKPSDQVIVMTRIFKRAAKRLFEAYTDPIALPLWWERKRFSTTVEKKDGREARWHLRIRPARCRRQRVIRRLMVSTAKS